MAGVKAKGKRIAIGTGLIAAAVLAVSVVVAWPHIYFFYLFASLGPNAQGYPEYRHRQTGIVFVRLPGGKFWMGAQATDPNGQNYDPEAADDEAPVHEVTLSPFLIAKTEVTQAQWKRVIGSNPSRFTGDEDRPVEMVSWDDIQEFEAKTGLALPTEAEWEFACRGGDALLFTGKLEDLGWFFGNSGGKTHPVGTKAPNNFGLHDVNGNVSECVEDVFDIEFYIKPEASGFDPISRTGVGQQVRRGGGWKDVSRICRSSNRAGIYPESGSFDIGFRPAMPVPGS